MEWLKDGGLIDGVSEDLEKIKQQIKRRKMTLKRKQNKSCQSTSSSSKDGPSSEESTEESTEEYALEDMFSEEPEFTGSTSVDAGFDVDEEDPLCNAKITLLQDDSYVSFVDSPPADRNDTPVYDFYHRQAEHGLQVEVPQDAAAEDFFDNGPYSPTSVVYESRLLYLASTLPMRALIRSRVSTCSMPWIFFLEQHVNFLRLRSPA